jgi:cyclohexanecarboxylate-CoA ligase
VFFETRLTTERIRAHTAAGHWRGRVLCDFVQEHAARAPEHPAIIGPGDRPALSYRALLEQADRAALALLERGVRPADVVSVQLPNWPEFVVLLLACERIGVVMNPLTPILRERELAQMLALGQSRVLVVPGAFRGFDHGQMAAKLAAQAPSLDTVIVCGPGAAPRTVTWDAFLGDRERPVDPRDRAWLDRLRPDPNAVTELAFTSGTTGEPKGVLHTHNTAVATVGSTLRRQGLHPGSVVHVASPVGHNSGYFYGVRLALQAGGTIVLQDVWDPREAARLIEQHRITFTMGASTFLIDLLGVSDLERYDLTSLEVFMCGGASIPPALAQEAMRRLPGRLCPVFGMTEHGHSTGTDPDTPLEKVCTTDGSPQPEMELRIADAAGRPLEPGQEGRLLLRGPFNFIGYIQGRRFSDAFFDDEDFFDSGDLAYLDADGYLRITGRAKDLIIRGGENVPVKEIEDVLAQHPNVREVALVGIPDPRLGERGVAFVRLAPGTTFSLDEMRAFLAAQNMTRQFWPEQVLAVEDFPRTASGKIQKYLLRARLADSARDGAPRQ